MSIPMTFAQIARLSLCAIFLSSQGVLANPNQRVIFPGDPLPAELTYKPLKVGSDVQVSARDWFMLKDRELALSSPVPGKTIDYAGPILDNNNAQVYFRIASGMILKESMIRMGMNPAQAVRFLEAAQENGADFASTPLAKLGPLPKGLAELYENWDRPVYKMALLPYLLLPLAVAYDQSNLQHFALAGVEDKPAQKTCSTINTAAPLGPVQNRINERNKSLDALNTELRNAQARLQQSNIEQVRMTADLRKFSNDLATSLTCFSSVTERVSRGGNMPSEDCLASARAVLADNDMTAEWEKFTAHNLKNERGDFTDKQKADEKLKNVDARLLETQNQVQALKDLQAKTVTEQTEAAEKVQRLNADLQAQNAEETKTAAEKNDLQAELIGIQTLNHKLETGAFEGSDAERQTAIQATAARAQRMSAVRARLSAILQGEVKFQVNQAAIVRQIEFLTASIDAKKASLESIASQLTDPSGGLDAKLTALRAQVKEAAEIHLRVGDEARFSELILSKLNSRLSDLTRSRDNLFASVKKEEALAETYKQQIAAAQKTLDAQAPALNKDLGDLEAMIASYKNVANMGWFLETDCEARANFGKEKLGVYLSRAKVLSTVTVAAAPVPGQQARLVVLPSDAGRWGLFNMDYNVFKAAIQNGILLNLDANIQLAVQQIVENYDFAMTQQLDPATQKCADAGNTVANGMKIAFSVWNLGNDNAAKTKSVTCRAANAVADPASNAVRDFQSSLAKLIVFEGSLLDQALPKAGRSHPKDLIEREAIVGLGRELGTLSGLGRKAAADRDVTIKALIRVLAADYDNEVRKQRAASGELSQTEFIFATEAPNNAGVLTAELQPGAEYPVNTLAAVTLYTAPVADPKYASNLQVSYRDRVKVLSPVRSGWVKVQARDRELWMAARSLATQTLTDEAGREVSGFWKLQNCANPVLVNLRGGRASTVRLANNIKTLSNRAGVMRIDVARTAKVSPASPAKTYVSCEKFELNGQTAALRLVEVQVIRARNGETTYLPVEDIGGFVLLSNQIVEGAAIDPSNWSARR